MLESVLQQELDKTLPSPVESPLSISARYTLRETIAKRRLVPLTPAAVIHPPILSHSGSQWP